MTWFSTPIPMAGFNGVLQSHMQPEQVSDRVEQLTRIFREKRKPWGWVIGPGSQPRELGRLLQVAGMYYTGGETAMAADLLALNEEIRAPEGLAISRVLDEDDLERFMAAMIDGFGPPEDFNRAWQRIFKCIGLREDCPMRHYLGTINGQPVGSASLFLGAGVAGIYMVATVPKARRHGIASAMTLAALRDARTMGYRVSILQASGMGASVYRRLGFKECGTLQFYAPAD